MSERIKPDKPIRIAVVLQDLEFGGSQRYAIHLVGNLNRELFSPELWVLRHGEDMAPLARETGAPVVQISTDSWVSPRSLLFLANRLFRHRPQVLYTLTVVPNIWARILGRVMRVPVVVSGYRSLLPNQHERWLWRLSDRVIVNAHALKDIMISRFKVGQDRIAVVPNGVDPDHFCPVPAAESVEPVVLSLGRFVEDKDPVNLVSAFCIAAKRVPGARFEIMGNGPLKDEAERFIRACKMESRISLLPGVSDVRPHLRRATIFALASVREASPNVILEAMACGRPVVATRVGGIPELLLDGETGTVVEPGNPEAFAEALVDLLTNESKRQRMGLKARERILEEFTLEKMVRRTEEVILEAVDCRI
jgi:glycosyltransferase involved in cell wall biosynthesis